MLRKRKRTEHHRPQISVLVRKFFPFALFLTLFKFAGGLHYTLLAPFGDRVFPLQTVGVIIGAAAFLQLILDIPAGYILDRFGYRRMLQWTTLLFGIAAIALLFGLSKATFLITIFASTFGWLFFGPGTNAYVIRWSSPETVGRFIATKDVFNSIGIVLASVALFGALTIGVHTIGLILIALFGLAFVAITFAPAEKHIPQKVQRKKKTVDEIRDLFRMLYRLRPVSFLLMLFGFTVSTFYALIWFVIPLLIADDIHARSLSIGLGVFDFSIVILGFILGTLVDRFNKKWLIVVGLLLFSVTGLLLGFHLGVLFILLGFLATTGEELTGLSLWAWLSIADPKNRHYGIISAAVSMFDDLGWTVGPIVAGFLYVGIGPSMTIACGGILVALNLLIFLLIPKRLRATSE